MVPPVPNTNIFVFVFNRLRQIGFTDVTGEDYALVLKRSVIEGQEINEQSLERITQIFVAIVDAHKGRSGRSA